ncbi:hypothetical protein FGO68_gene8884 [Halteria grandinella]|uniref:Uncharacterized protein n=1 Tax=Halteria grandinella TaxID=5974 RepID=A0A8J8T4B1_HALGN|nr:hypothetical protein FGO68_gene8884 [Halteria grandinella]
MFEIFDQRRKLDNKLSVLMIEEGSSRAFIKAWWSKTSWLRKFTVLLIHVGIACMIFQLMQMANNTKEIKDEDTSKFSNWDGYVHGRMRWGKIDDFIMPNPLQTYCDSKVVMGEFEGQLYKNQPHGIGIFKPDKAISACPIEFAYMTFYKGMPHGGPVFMRLKNGRTIIIDELNLGIPNGVSIIYESECATDFLTSKDKKEDVSGIVRDIRENHSILSKKPIRLIEYEEETAVLFNGILLKNGDTQKMEGYGVVLNDKTQTRPYKVSYSKDM